MKTTVEIPDALLRSAKKHCAERGMTFRQLMEIGLRKALEQPKPAGRFRMKPFGFRGEGQIEHDWEAIREMIYQGRGGSPKEGDRSK